MTEIHEYGKFIRELVPKLAADERLLAREIYKALATSGAISVSDKYSHLLLDRGAFLCARGRLAFQPGRTAGGRSGGFYCFRTENTARAR
jgi:hypothetical protein